jgi:hypothetical protein
MQNQNQNQMLFPSHNAVVVVASTSSAARVCGHSQLYDSSRQLLLRLLQRHPGAMRTYTPLAGWLAGAFGWQAAALWSNEPNLRLRGDPANGGDEVGADSRDGRSPPRSR